MTVATAEFHGFLRRWAGSSYNGGEGMFDSGSGRPGTGEGRASRPCAVIQQLQQTPPASATDTVLTTIVLTDLVDSTKFTEKYGDGKAAEIFARSDRMARDLLREFGGREVDRTDGFLLLFNRPVDAVRFALAYHARLAALAVDMGIRLAARVGVHLGELILIRNSADDVARGAKPIEVEGLAKPQAARVMSLAQGGQTLLTRGVFDLARRAAVGDAALPVGAIWMAHGPYLMKGVEEPVEVFEVGVEGVAPLAAPPDTEKVRRSVAAGDEETLGWRPAPGVPIPHRKGWVLDRKLGEGGFGEVWLGMHERTASRRVFKFCFNAEKLRSLKRELTLFRLLREALGDRKDIARLHDVQLEEPPFFLESDFTEFGSLIDWAESQGGIDRVALPLRLDLVTRTAQAVAAAHSVGILHKDIKPGNILVYADDDGKPRPRLSDFGIGSLTEAGRAAGRNITMVGFTGALDSAGLGATTTQMYAPPELLVGKPFTIAGDIFSLGVVLYQMVVGDLEAPLAEGWEDGVADPLLREDIARCVAGEEADRFASASELAQNLATLPQRRKARVRRRVARIAALSSVILVAAVSVLAIVLVRENHLKNQAIDEKMIQERISAFFNNGIIGSADPAQLRADRETGRDVKVVSILPYLEQKAEDDFADRPDVKARVRRVLGLTYKNFGEYDRARAIFESILRFREEHYAGEDHPETAESHVDLGDVLWFQREYAEAMPHYETALAMRLRLFPETSAPVAEALNNLAACQTGEGMFDVAEANYRKALNIRQGLPQPFDQMLVAATQNNLATCLRLWARALAESDPRRADLRDQAKSLYEQALETARRVGTEQHFYVGRGLHNLAQYLVETGRHAEAEARFREAIETKRGVLGDDHLSVAESEHALAACMLGLERADEAIGHAVEAVRIRESSAGTPAIELAESLTLLGAIHSARGDTVTSVAFFARSESTLLAELDRRSTTGPAAVPATLRVYARLESLYSAWNRPDKAAEYRLLQEQLAANGGGK